jgi:hypothetical protein
MEKTNKAVIRIQCRCTTHMGQRLECKYYDAGPNYCKYYDKPNYACLNGFAQKEALVEASKGVAR